VWPSNTAQYTQFGLGTVAGTTTVALASLVDNGGNSVLPSPAPSQKTTISAGAPVIGTAILSATSTSVTVVVTGASSKRSVTGATYTFNPSSSQPITTTLSFTSGTYAGVDQQWFTTATSLAGGGGFTLTATFSCSNCNLLTAAQVALTN
jgi:hypothetical protein